MRKCPKCGGEDVEVRYVATDQSEKSSINPRMKVEHLWCTCKCGYWWKALCTDWVATDSTKPEEIDPKIISDKNLRSLRSW